MSKIRVASVEEIAEGKGVLVEVEGASLALFRHDGEFFAVDETCPHRGGPLHEGVVQDGVLACPWHLWTFDLRTGVCPLNPLSKVKVYRTWTEGSDVYVEM